MRASILDVGFSVADTSHPALVSGEGRLTASFSSSSRQPVTIEFSNVAAFHWHESGPDRLLEGERYDGVCEIFGSDWLAQHTPGRTMHSVPGLRHIRLNFNVRVPGGPVYCICKTPIAVCSSRPPRKLLVSSTDRRAAAA